jgi:hypothetical protein
MPGWRTKCTVGFTGSRQRPTLAQAARIAEWLFTLDPKRACHGDCVGSDERFHGLAKMHLAKTCVHPPIDSKLRAWCEGDEVAEPKEYMERNEDVVAHADHLLAAPSGREREQPRSGTWATIRRARRKGIPRWIAFPDGSSVREYGREADDD